MHSSKDVEDMKKTSEEEMTCLIWIDHSDKIVSFKRAEGFEQLRFSSQKEKFAFAMEKCSSGYRIQ